MCKSSRGIFASREARSPQAIGSFVSCTSLDSEVPLRRAQIHFVLPFPESRGQKAEAAAVCVKAGQRPPWNGRRALTQTASTLMPRTM